MLEKRLTLKVIINDMPAETISSTLIAKWLFMAIWSILGGVVNVLIEKRKGKVLSHKDGAILAFISSFIGSLWCLASLTFYPDNTVLAVLAGGFGGLMSLEGLAFVITFIKQKFIKE